MTGTTLNVTAGSGDMILASTQTNSGLKTFLNGTFGLRNIANTITSLFSSAATVARTYTLQDRDGTLADGTDLALKANLASPTFTGNITTPALVVAGNISQAAWTTTGLRIRGVPTTLTDTTSIGTVAAAYTDSFGGNTIAATSATTFTDYITAFFKEPLPGTNVTFTRKTALGAESLRIGTSNQMTVSLA